MTLIDPSQFRWRAFEAYWERQLQAIGGSLGDCEPLMELLQGERALWLRRGTEVGHFPTQTGFGEAPPAGVADPAAAWAFDRALSQALDFLTADQVEAAWLLLLADGPEWTRARERVATLLRQLAAGLFDPDYVERTDWLLQEWPWDEQDGTLGTWPADWRLTKLPEQAHLRGTSARVEEARQMREAVRTACQAAAPHSAAVPLKLRLGSRVANALATFKGSVRPVPVMGGSTADELPMAVRFEDPADEGHAIEARMVVSGTKVFVWFSGLPQDSRRVLLALAAGEAVAQVERTVESGERVLRFELDWTGSQLPTELVLAVLA